MSRSLWIFSNYASRCGCYYASTIAAIFCFLSSFKYDFQQARRLVKRSDLGTVDDLVSIYQVLFVVRDQRKTKINYTERRVWSEALGASFV